MKRNTSFLKGFGSETMNKWIANGEKNNKPLLSTNSFNSNSFIVIKLNIYLLILTLIT